MCVCVRACVRARVCVWYVRVCVCVCVCVFMKIFYHTLKKWYEVSHCPLAKQVNNNCKKNISTYFTKYFSTALPYIRYIAYTFLFYFKCLYADLHYIIFEINYVAVLPNLIVK